MIFRLPRSAIALLRGQRAPHTGACLSSVSLASFSDQRVGAGQHVFLSLTAKYFTISMRGSVSLIALSSAELAAAERLVQQPRFER
jgi:hypothetical protein